MFLAPPQPIYSRTERIETRLLSHSTPTDAHTASKQVRPRAAHAPAPREGERAVGHHCSRQSCRPANPHLPGTYTLRRVRQAVASRAAMSCSGTLLHRVRSAACSAWRPRSPRWRPPCSPRGAPRAPTRPHTYCTRVGTAGGVSRASSKSAPQRSSSLVERAVRGARGARARGRVRGRQETILGLFDASDR